MYSVFGMAVIAEMIGLVCFPKIAIQQVVTPRESPEPKKMNAQLTTTPTAFFGAI